MQKFNKLLGIYQEEPPPTIEALQAFPIFKGYDAAFLKRVQPHTLLLQVDKGDIILREGEYGDSAYYIAKGTVEVVLPAALKRKQEAIPTRPAARKTGGPAAVAGRAKSILDERKASPGAGQSPARPVRSDTVILTSLPADIVGKQRILLAEGEIFGEMSALSRYPQSASVVADTDCSILQIRVQALRLIQKKSPEFKEFVDQRYRQRSLSNHLMNVRLFADCDEAFIRDLTGRVQLYSYEPGESIIKQGEPADAFYLVRSGFVKVSQRVGESDLTISYISKGEYCGEIALLFEEPWIFTLTAYDHVDIVKVSREDFQMMIREYPAIEKSIWEVTVSRLKDRGRVARTPGASAFLQMALDEGLIHGNSILLIDLDTCTRCDDCVRGCQSTHGGTPRFIREGAKFQNFLIPTACYHCTDPVCMIGCPTGAITRLGAGYQVVISDACIGCGNCANRCPWGNIIAVPEVQEGKSVNISTKCDLCEAHDGRPACVYNCPNGSAVRISFKDLDRVMGQIGV
jgi:CRP-like cAMP-binding protein/Fe-S-cluster-containing hydrogenase component 2